MEAGVRPGLARLAALLSAAVALAVTSPIKQTHAEDAVSFKDKTVTIVVGFTPGGSPDVISRAVADGMAKRLPGKPAVIVRNVPGAEGVVALNTVVTQSKPDGLTLVTGAGGNFDPLYYRNARAVYDPERLIYAGGIATTGSSLLMNKAALSRLYDKNAPPVIMGASNNIRTTMWAVILGTEILHWNVKWVFGYPGTNDLRLALTRGEIDMTTTSDIEQIRIATGSGNFVTYFQTGTQVTGSLVPRAEFGDAPMFTDLIKDKVTDPAAREAVAYWTDLIKVGDWLALVPGTPDPIVAAHRQAFHEIVNDPEFIERAKTVFPEVIEVTGPELAKIAGNLAGTSPATLAYLSRLRETLRR
jgi:tripartite-type tricarboxylate transporter receptor subunit TctC